MSNQELEQVIEKIRASRAGWDENTSMETIRIDLDVLACSFAGVAGSTVDQLDANGVPAEFVAAPSAGSDGVVLYLHGGGFAVHSAKSHRHLAQWISNAAGVRVLVVDYRLVPEHRFPAQLEDARAAYDWLLQRGTDPGKLCIAGDSAGGGLALALTAVLRGAETALPAGVATVSAWADARCAGNSYRELADVDPVGIYDMALSMGADYVGEGGNLDDPYASPVHLDYAGFPPLLLQVGTRDMFIDDSRTVAAAARAAGVSVQLDEWAGMIHQWPMYAAELEEGRRAIDEMGGFIRRCISAR
ncbi:MAG: alpha/beta hydrolase [Halieaceae bacterium]|nr:alpha/beta hydrolase [Halieaceae bacterium]